MSNYCLAAGKKTVRAGSQKKDAGKRAFIPFTGPDGNCKLYFWILMKLYFIWDFTSLYTSLAFLVGR